MFRAPPPFPLFFFSPFPLFPYSPFLFSPFLKRCSEPHQYWKHLAETNRNWLTRTFFVQNGIMLNVYLIRPNRFFQFKRKAKWSKISEIKYCYPRMKTLLLQRRQRHLFAHWFLIFKLGSPWAIFGKTLLLTGRWFFERFLMVCNYFLDLFN